MTSSPARDIEAWLALALVPGVGPVTQRKLIEHFGSPRHALAAASDEVARFLGDASVARHLARGANRALIDKTLAWSSAPGNHVVTFDHPDYPKRIARDP